MSIPAVNKDAVITAKFSLLRFLWGKVLGGQNQAVVKNRLCQDKLSFTYKIWIHDISSKRISHTLAHLETNSYKIFQISQNFQTILQNILCRNKHQSHFDMFITSILHLNKGYWLLWGSSKVIFVKLAQNFITSPLKTYFSPQLMACMISPKSHKKKKKVMECWTNIFFK